MSDEAPKALEHFFTVEEYVCLPGDRTAWYAINKASGIMCPGRDTFDLALQDAEAINAAVKRATEDLRARVAELEKIEAEAKAHGMLTADGKLITPGMEVWVPDHCPDDGDEKTPWIIGSIDHETSMLNRRGWLLSQFRTHVGEPYYTREAAEAARAAKEGGASC